MSEFLDNARQRKELLKHMILQLHAGQAPEAVRPRLVELLGKVPYGEVVAVEQELITEGLPAAEVQRLCDAHSAALQGALEAPAAAVAPGHPVDVFRRENQALHQVVQELTALGTQLEGMPPDAPAAAVVDRVLERLNALSDVDKHYQRKEHLLFPFLEKHGITGPPTVMWGKHDQARALLKDAREAMAAAGSATAAEAAAVVGLLVRPATDAVAGMIDKEDQILLPMCLDTLTDAEWFQVARGSAEIGWCLVDPVAPWQPASHPAQTAAPEAERIATPSGTLTLPQLTALLDALPVDTTFVDAEDTVRWFNRPQQRVFPRPLAVLGRKVQFCHPPSSVHVVQRILDALRRGEKDHATFWIQMRGRFVHIDYRALRDAHGTYLGCLEMTEDLTDKRALTGEQRLLAWDTPQGGTGEA